MKSIRSRITLSYMLMFFSLWFIAGTVGIIYVRKAIFQHSADAQKFLLQKKITVLDTAIEEITQNVLSMSSYISTFNTYDKNFYEELKERAILAFGDQSFVKTIYFCPDFQETSSSECMYLLSLSNASPLTFNFRSNYLDMSFDVNQKGENNKENIPWFYAAKELKSAAWIGTYQCINIEDVTFMISYFMPVFSEGKFRGVVGIEISTLSLRSEIDNMDYGNAFGILANAKGDLIYHRDFPSGLPSEYFDIYDELSPLKNVFSKEYAGQNDVFTYSWKNKNQKLIFGKLRNGMTLAISVPEAELLPLQGRFLLTIVILIIMTMLLANIILAIVTNKIVKPIEIINQAADYIAHGELNTKIPVYSKDELGMLATSMRKIEVELSEYIAHIREMAYKDFMTGCHNKSAYLKLQSSLEKKIDEGMAFFNVYMFDVNGLKRINDTQGHEMGDALIKGAASVLKTTFDENSIFRTGGDEFVVIIEDEKDDIKANISAFEEALADFNEENELDFTLTISIGTASFRNDHDKDFKSVAERADRAMYENKEDFYRNHKDLRR